MNSDSSSLGRCPDCGRSISETWKLIEWRQEDGSVGVFAECPECDEVVKPE
nr:phage terminase large subunit family protein [Salinigranum halophilum]